MAKNGSGDIQISIVDREFNVEYEYWNDAFPEGGRAIEFTMIEVDGVQVKQDDLSADEEERLYEEINELEDVGE